MRRPRAKTAAIAAPAADEVSAAISALFGTHAQEFQTLSAEAAAFHESFVSLLNGGAAQYASTEIANASQTAVAAANSTTAPVHINNNFNLGPLELSLSQSTASLPGGGSRQAGNALVSLNLPWGRVGLGSVGGWVTQTANAGSAVGYLGSTPVGPLELSLGGPRPPCRRRVLGNGACKCVAKHPVG